MNKNNSNINKNNAAEYDYMEMSINPIVETGIKRKTDIFTIIIFLCLVFIPAVLFWIIPDVAVSEEEKRSLQQMPEFTFKNLSSGKLTKDMGSYYADQFPFRNAFVGAKTLFSYGFLLNENKGAIIAKDGYLIQRFDKYSEKSIKEKSDAELGDGTFTFEETMANIKNNCGYLNKFYEKIKDLRPDIKMTVAVTPRKIDALTSRLPAFFPLDRHEKYFDELYKDINKALYFDLLNVMRSKNEEYIYYKTDLHWTTLGAYYAYAALGETLGYKPFPKEDFTVETASENFYGTTWSKAGVKWIKPDIIEYYNYNRKYKEGFKTEIHGNDSSRTLNGFYDREKLETKDQYSSFLGGLNGHISVYVPDTVIMRRKLLLISDSFGWSIAPFLALHYDIELIDTRYFNGDIYDFIEENNINIILTLHNMESLSTQNNLSKLSGK